MAQHLEDSTASMSLGEAREGCLGTLGTTERSGRAAGRVAAAAGVEC